MKTGTSNDLKLMMVDLNKASWKHDLVGLNLSLKKPRKLFNGSVYNSIENVGFATGVIQRYKRIPSKFNKTDFFLCITSMDLSEALTLIQNRCHSSLSGAMPKGTLVYDYSEERNFLKFDSKCLVFHNNDESDASNWNWESKYYCRFLIEAKGVYLYQKDAEDHAKMLFQVVQMRTCGEIPEGELQKFEEPRYATCLL